MALQCFKIKCDFETDKCVRRCDIDEICNHAPYQDSDEVDVLLDLDNDNWFKLIDYLCYEELKKKHKNNFIGNVRPLTIRRFNNNNPNHIIWIGSYFY